MKIIRLVLLTVLALSVSQCINGQSRPHVPGQVLVRLTDRWPSTDLLTKLKETTAGSRVKITKQISRHLNIWLIETPDDSASGQYWLDYFQRQPAVLAAQFNHILESRSPQPALVPDDPFFVQQWQHLNTGAGGGSPDADLDSEEAWEIATGGLTATGDTIVVAVIDGGIDSAQEDLMPNLWYNRQEIPGDGADNDGNGYIDDFKGWNVYLDNDNIEGLSTGHGTPVSAIIAARGNNGIGVTGINWDVKLMFVAGNSVESAILEAYDYVLNARKLYNASQGQSGAFVVAVNCSWGITFGQPANSPLWCAAFDSLGAAGILSVAATANTALDVDVAGDLPTACPSDFLISVTNLNKWNQKPSNSAWGLTTIDLGAYGKDVFTAGPNNSYGTFSGTSFAAPQVSGAIGLLYSAPCDNLGLIAKADPATAALLAKNLILNSAVPNNSLAGITVTGAGLNLYNMLVDYQDQCLSCIAPLATSVEQVDENTLRLRWAEVANLQNVSLRWRKKGEPVWLFIPDVSSPFDLSDLQACSIYEFSLRSSCGPNHWSDWSMSFSEKTPACCLPPAFISASNITDSSATITWSHPPMAQNYKVHIRPAGGAWKEFPANSNSLKVNTLIPCTYYEIELYSVCGVDSISLPVRYNFHTLGCGACTDKLYCTAGATSASNEWIGGVEIGPWKNYSGGGPGYVDYTGTPLSLLEILPDANLPLIITPAFSSAPYLEYFRLYIDYNADGDFSDPGEMAFDPGFASNAQVSGWLNAPADMAWGPSRMRILMKYKDLQSSPPGPCESFNFGQVEDYCVHLGAKLNTTPGENGPDKLLLYPQPASGWVSIRLPAPLNEKAILSVFDLTSTLSAHTTARPQQQEIPLDVRSLPSGTYLIRIQTGNTIYYQKLMVLH